jgi:hypothetical protein
MCVQAILNRFDPRGIIFQDARSALVGLALSVTGVALLYLNMPRIGQDGAKEWQILFGASLTIGPLASEGTRYWLTKRFMREEKYFTLGIVKVWNPEDKDAKQAEDGVLGRGNSDEEAFDDGKEFGTKLLAAAGIVPSSPTAATPRDFATAPLPTPDESTDPAASGYVDAALEGEATPQAPAALPQEDELEEVAT